MLIDWCLKGGDKMGSENALVSVIMPVYNVEKYLSQCINSVCTQTYNNLEIIIVDDESPDDSGTIADEYAKKDDRIKVLHIKNRGAAGARNIGLDTCSGEFVLFIDSDDWIEPDMVEKMVNYIINENCDIVQCQSYDEYTDKSIEHISESINCYMDNQEFMKHALYHWEDLLIWNKIIKKDIIGNIRFVEGRCIDDEFFTYKLIINSDRIFLTNEKFYHYRMRKSGAMLNDGHKKQRLQDQIDFMTGRYDERVNTFPDIKNEILAHLCETLIHVMRNSGEYKEIYSIAKNQLTKYGGKALLSGVSMNLKKSIVYCLSKGMIAQNETVLSNEQNNLFE